MCACAGYGKLWPPARCPIELNAATLETEAAYLFVEDDGRVLRFQLHQSDVRIGRDQSNDIWIDNPAVRPQTCLVYQRDGAHHLKVYDGAKVLLNGQAVRGLNRLYSGDRMGVGDRELLYARDDAPAQVAVGLTVMLDGVVQYGLTYRRTRVRIGRRNADLVLDDATVADEHLVIESYSDHGWFAFDVSKGGGTFVNGLAVEERCRLHDGDVIQLGRVMLRMHLLPVEAFGLLLAAPLPERPKVPIAAPKPMDRSPAQRMDPSAASARSRQADGRAVAGGFVRSHHNANAAMPLAEPPPPVPVAQRPPAPEPLAPAPDHQQHGPEATQIGSLQQMMRAAQRVQPGGDFGEPQHTVMADAVRAQLGDYAPRPPVSDQPPPLPAAANVPVERPAVRINVDATPSARKPEPPQSQQRTQAPAWPDESAQRENLRVRPRESVEDSQLVPVSSPAPRRGGMGFHDQHTEMLDTQAIANGARGADWQRDPVLRKVFSDSGSGPNGAPATAVLDTNQGEPALPPMTRSQRAADERFTRGAPAGDRYRLSQSADSREVPPEPLPVQASRDDDPQPPRSGWADPDRYRLSRGEASDRRPVQDDRPRVRVRPLSEAERTANPAWAQATDKPRPPSEETDASRRLREEKAIDGSRRGFDRDR